jgi:hypothetical protein
MRLEQEILRPTLGLASAIRGSGLAQLVQSTEDASPKSVLGWSRIPSLAEEEEDRGSNVKIQKRRMASAEAKCRCDSDKDRVKTAITRAEGRGNEREGDFKLQVQVSGCLLSVPDF